MIYDETYLFVCTMVFSSFNYLTTKIITPLFMLRLHADPLDLLMCQMYSPCMLLSVSILTLSIRNEAKPLLNNQDAFVSDALQPPLHSTPNAFIVSQCMELFILSLYRFLCYLPFSKKLFLVSPFYDIPIISQKQ